MEVKFEEREPLFNPQAINIISTRINWYVIKSYYL